MIFPQGRAVPGLGEDSWWGVNPEGGLLNNVLYVVQGGKTYVVQLVLFQHDDKKNEQIAVAIARKLLENV